MFHIIVILNNMKPIFAFTKKTRGDMYRELNEKNNV